LLGSAVVFGRADALFGAGRSLLRALPGLAPTFLIVALLACVLVPLPTMLVDLLLTVSLAGAVLLLVASVSIGRTTEFSSFPTLLLLVTLFRLALNVSTTRLILSQADAGEVIEAFAGVVVRGDLIVGGVMFMIITIVQYVVIARGAERVAEVAARFALDGLPGHQAAIDADLRAGVISASEAALRRARLAERSSFYGAMDGAIRFVKGDAVAGLAITAVNLTGGLVIGMTRMGFDWQQSLEVYGRLTIGDGLLAQIPALLVSLAAGVLVSRVDRAPEATRAPWLQPPMLLVPATMLLALAAAPAMPSLAFVTTAVALCTGALLLTARAAAKQRLGPPPTHERIIEVRLARVDAGDPRTLERALAEVRLRCCEALGIEVPPIGLRIDRGHPSGLVEVSVDERLQSRTRLANAADIDAVVLATFRAVMDHADALYDLQDLDRALEQLRSTHPVLVASALNVVDLPDLLAIIRGLLRERIPLPPLRIILGVLAERRPCTDPDARRTWPERARLALAPYWMSGVLDALGRLGPPRWIRIEPDAEEELLDRWTTGDVGCMVAMSPAERARWHAQLLGVASDLAGPEDSNVTGPRQGPIVVLTTPRSRQAAAQLFCELTPHIPVLTTAELQSARVALPEQPRWLTSPE
jgi:type III secretion protein V